MDHVLHALVRLLVFPYELWKQTIENSRVGPSQSELETLRFWRWFAIIGLSIPILLVVGVYVFFRYLLD